MTVRTFRIPVVANSPLATALSGLAVGSYVDYPASSLPTLVQSMGSLNAYMSWQTRFHWCSARNSFIVPMNGVGTLQTIFEWNIVTDTWTTIWGPESIDDSDDAHVYDTIYVCPWTGRMFRLPYNRNRVWEFNWTTSRFELLATYTFNTEVAQPIVFHPSLYGPGVGGFVVASGGYARIVRESGGTVTSFQYWPSAVGSHQTAVLLKNRNSIVIGGGLTSIPAAVVEIQPGATPSVANTVTFNPAPTPSTSSGLSNHSNDGQHRLVAHPDGQSLLAFERIPAKITGDNVWRYQFGSGWTQVSATNPFKDGAWAGAQVTIYAPAEIPGVAFGVVAGISAAGSGLAPYPHVRFWRPA